MSILFKATKLHSFCLLMSFAWLLSFDLYISVVIDDQFEMPDKLVSMLVRFPEQNGGTLSERARTNEFPKLKDDEVEKIESAFHEIFEIRRNKDFTKRKTIIE